MSQLPIHDFLDKIQHTLSTHKSLVLQAEPGAGKSTVVPLDLLSAPWLAGQKIIMLEPRRVAAKSIAHYLAKQLQENVGERVGYHVKNDRKIGPNTQLEIVTEGILTRRLQVDPELSQVALIIFDEFHERSLQADVSLLLALEVQQALRDDLKLLVMSATIDTQFIANYLSDDSDSGTSTADKAKQAAIIECPGRAFPVELSYHHGKFTQLSDHVLSALHTALSHEDNGDVLVFLPGQADILRCLEHAQRQFNPTDSDAQKPIVFLPLYGSLSMAEQEHALQIDKQGRRRVIFATNIAETSLTINGVSWVIDSGLEKRLQYDPSSGMSRLDTVSISKASAQQRKGRAGRLRAGHCIRLWGEAKQIGLLDFQPEEILSAELASTVLELYAWGHTDYTATPWLTAPPLGHYQTAEKLLLDLQLIDTKKALTTRGQRALTLGVHPRLASMLLRSENAHEQSIACDVAALLTEQDIFHRGSYSQPTYTSSVDISERFMALQDSKANKKHASQRYPLKRYAVEQVFNLSSRLLKSISQGATQKRVQGVAQKIERDVSKTSHNPSTRHDWQTSLATILLRAHPDRLAKQRHHSTRYIMANGKGVFLPEDDALLGSEWLIVNDCDAQKREGRIYSACPIDQQQVLSLLSDQFETTHQYQLDSKKQKIIGRQYVRYEAITIDETALSHIPAEEFQICLIDVLKTEGLNLLQWTPRCEQWLNRVEWLAAYNEHFPRLSHDYLQRTVTEWLLPYTSHITTLPELKKYSIYDLLTANLTWEQQQQLEIEAPSTYVSPSGQTVAIVYDKNQGPTVSIILQEMFGELASPSLAYGQVPLRFELLSPARRPIQTTSDLANFWVSSYFEVAKDMRAKYPKHRWPEKPLLAEPGRSRKPRKF